MQPGAFLRGLRGIGRGQTGAGCRRTFPFALRALAFADGSDVCLRGRPLLLALPLLGEPLLVLHLREESCLAISAAGLL